MAVSPAQEPRIRVVVFGGAWLERAALELIARLDTHEEIELLGVWCQSAGLDRRHRIIDVVRRRGLVAIPLLASDLFAMMGRRLRAPAAERAFREALRTLDSRIHAVPDLHAPALLDHLRRLEPDLGIIYGAPVLRPELFRIPRAGTIGVHHGRVPEYRGRKTTFWEVYNGESVAGVTIQRVDAGIDTGDVVREAAVPIGSRWYGTVWSEVQRVGVDLCIQSVLQVRRGTVTYTPQREAQSTIYRPPRAVDLVRLWWRWLTADGL